MLRKIFTTSRLYGSSRPWASQILPRLSSLLATVPLIAYFFLFSHQELNQSPASGLDLLAKLLIGSLVLLLALAGLLSLGLGIYFLLELGKELRWRWIISQRHYSSELDLENDDLITQSVVYLEMKTDDKGVFDLSTEVIDQADYWRLYDAKFNFYSKLGSHQAYHTVYEARLCQAVGHLSFDTNARRRYRRTYAQAKTVSLGQPFDDHFKLQVQPNLSDDSLTLLTADVQEACLAMKNCELEILSDHLLCFSPLLRAQELEDFKLRAEHLHQLLNNQLARLKPARSTAVSPLGSRLQQSPVRWLITALAYLPLIGLGWLAGSGNLSNSQTETGLSIEVVVFLTGALLGFGHALYKYILIKRHNQQLASEAC